MRRVLLTTAAAVLLSGAAFAADPTNTAPASTTAPMTPTDTMAAGDPMHGLYGNTMTVTGPEASQKWQYLFQNDKTYVMVDAFERVHRGTWNVKGASLCLTPIAESAMPPAQTSCHAMPQLSSVGDTWSYKSADGKPFIATLNQGAEAFAATGSIDKPGAKPETKPAKPEAKPKSGVNTEATSPAPGGTIAQ